MNYIVLSDLHIGGDTKLDICHSQGELGGFLTSLDAEPLTLVINGDFIDFLAVPPFGEFSRVAAQQKIAAIISARSNASLWDGFRRFLGANTKNRIEVMLGNHDLELIFDEVKDALSSVMAGKGDDDRIEFITDRVSHQKIKVGGVPVHVEHGFQYDPYNWYDQDALTKATIYGSPGDTFDLPVGSRLVYETLNKLTPDHPFLPLLKPETAAIYILLAIAPREVSRHLGMFGGVLGGNFFNKIRMRLRTQQFDVAEPVNLEDGRAALEGQLTNLFLDPDLHEETLDGIEEHIEKGDGESLSASSVSFGLFAGAKDKGRLYLLRKGLEGLKRERDSFFDVSVRDDFNQALDGILSLGAKVAIMGHSHGRKMLNLNSENDPARKLLYLNTGTWADLLDFDVTQLQSDEALQAWLDNLEGARAQPTQLFTYARLTELSGGRGARVSLEEWRDGKAWQVSEAQNILP